MTDYANVQVRCDAPIEVTIQHTGSLEPQVDVVTALNLNAHLTVAAAMYVGPSGHQFGQAQATFRIMDESYILEPGQECPCPRH